MPHFDDYTETVKKKLISFGQNLFDLATHKKFQWNIFSRDFPGNSEKSVVLSLKPRFLTLRPSENMFRFSGYGFCQIGNPIFQNLLFAQWNC